MLDEARVKIIKDHYHARDHNHHHYAFNSLGFGFIHYAIIRNVRPEHVLVVGSQRGFAPAICALACQDENKGHVDFVDAGYSEDEENAWGGLGIWKDADESYWYPLGLSNITIHNMRTDEFKPEHQYQYIYVDGDHSYEGVKRDYELLIKHLEPGGYMVFHDICVDKQTKYGQCGVQQFWNELKMLSCEMGTEAISFPFEAGLGIIRK